MATILIIDDDVQILFLMRKMLEKGGYSVITARDGEKGLQLYRNSPCDLVITDMIMPNLSGINLVSDLLREFPEAKIIAISGGGAIKAPRYLEIARSLGAQATMTKPFAMQPLLETVEKVLSSSHPQDD